MIPTPSPSQPVHHRILAEDLPSVEKPPANYPAVANRLDQILIGVGQMNEVSQEIADIHLTGSAVSGCRARDSRGICITGNPRVGKSEIIDVYKYRLAPAPDKVLVVGVPSTSTHRQFTVKLLEALGDRYASEGKPEERLKRCLRLLKVNEIELVIFDEIQHLLNPSASPEAHRRGGDWLKELLDAAGIPFVLSGPPVALEIFKFQPELKGRISVFIDYDPLNWKVPERRADFLATLQCFEEALSFSHHSNLSDEKTAAKIYAVTQGRIGLVKSLIKRAAQLALRKKLSHITHVELERAIIETQINGK